MTDTCQTPRPIPALEQLREQQQALELQLAIHQQQTALDLIRRSQIAGLQESWNDPDNYVDPLQWRTDDQGRPLPGAGMGRWFEGVGDASRLGGAPFGNEQQLGEIRNAARTVCAQSALAAALLERLTDYVVGRGFAYSATTCQPGDEPIAAAVQQVIDEFLQRNDFAGDLDREIFARSRRDGEALVALYPLPGGAAEIRLVEPEQLTEPDDPRAVEDWLGAETPSCWRYGVHSDAGDAQSIHGYFIQWTERTGDFDYLPASRLEHLRINVDRNTKRGLSDFYPVLHWLDRADKLLRNTAEGAAIQAAIAYIKEHAPGVTQAAAETSTLLRASASVPQRVAGTIRAQQVQAFSPGTILATSPGTLYRPGPLGAAHAPNFIAVHQAVLRLIGNRWGMPEYMVSGDASGANYASTLVAESPFVNACEAKQAIYIACFRRLLWKAIDIAAAAGRFQPFGVRGEELRRHVKVKIEPPTVASRDIGRETDRRGRLHTAGVLSRTTWAAQEGLDWPQEQANQAAERPIPPIATSIQ